jgi:protein PhnA
VARGRDKHHARLAAVSALGKVLSRRARSCCELCGDGGRLSVSEVEGVPEEPELSWALLLCGRCTDLASAKRLDATDLRFLETAVWSEVQPAQLAAVRLVRRLSESGTGWASDVLDGIYLDPEIEGLL